MKNANAADRSLDKFIAQKILGYAVHSDSRGAVRETPVAGGQSRPLRSYSNDMTAAWEVATKLGVTLLPTDEGWFCLIGPENKWRSPAHFIEFLAKADFVKAGAAVSVEGPMSICLAALRWYENLESRGETEHDETPDNVISLENVNFAPHETI